MPFEVNLWKPQNAYFAIRQSILQGMRESAAQGDETAKQWVAEFAILGEAFGFAPLSEPPEQNAPDSQSVEMAMAK
jgi:hypothetical protein